MTLTQGEDYDDTFWIAFISFFISFLSWQFTGRKKDDNLEEK